MDPFLPLAIWCCSCQLLKPVQLTTCHIKHLVMLTHSGRQAAAQAPARHLSVLQVQTPALTPTPIQLRVAKLVDSAQL